MFPTQKNYWSLLDLGWLIYYGILVGPPHTRYLGVILVLASREQKAHTIDHQRWKFYKTIILLAQVYEVIAN